MRRGLSPVVAVLLLVAIGIVVGIMVYIWAVGIASQMMGVSVPQVMERLVLVAYDLTDSSADNDDPPIGDGWISRDGSNDVVIVCYVKNTGTVAVGIVLTDVFVDGRRIQFDPGATNDASASEIAVNDAPAPGRVVEVGVGEVVKITIYVELEDDEELYRSLAVTGTRHIVTFVTEAGGVFKFVVISGRAM